MDRPGGLRSFPREPLHRPIGVVLFCGPALERGTIRFARLLDEHADVDLLGVYCETPGLGLAARLRDLLRRRGLLAPLVAAVGFTRWVGAWLRSPGEARQARRDRRWILERIRLVEDLHAPEVLEEIQALDPDLGTCYGGPILREALFDLPRFGTLGIHHGRFPDYRGKKAALRALINDEERAGVTIQRIGAAIDAGPVVASAEVPARGRGLGAVTRDLDELGLDLFVRAVLMVAAGEASAKRPPGEPGPLHRDPGPRELLRYAGKRLGERLGPRDAGRAPGHGILLLTESYHPMIGGGETQARALAAGLVEVGVPVRVVTRRWDRGLPALGEIDGVPVHRVGPVGTGHLRKWGLLRTARRPIREYAHAHPVLVVNGFRVLGVPAVQAAKSRSPVRRVILKADSPGELSGDFFEGGLARFGLTPRSPPVRAALALRNRVLRQADAFVAISSEIEGELLRHGVPAGRIHRIPNGVDTGRFRPAAEGEREEARRRFGLPPQGLVVLYTGRLVRYKGLPLLLDVWGRIASRHPEAILVLAGEGGADLDNCEAELRAAAEGPGAVPRVRFTGPVRDVPTLLRGADIFVFPSEKEAFGISVIEAMASGIPITATRAGGLTDLVEEAQGGLPFEAGCGDGLEETLVRLLANPELRRRLGEAGRRAARERYDLSRVRDHWVEVIREGEAPSERHPVREDAGA